ncbi:hypothetical protein [Gimesia fumaroli]|uniref:Bacterial type II/III secretion system short domain protein n=1 Tax=Gimesia fumaroli TaxID=2527976 RepID=A0A518IJ80_9PLAN|nr:hypothetical protein [Gimesia fumaroli]QDV53125.1 hypothetical protein Enr17x_51960 [Gimesia fumaroli]
MAVSLTSCSNRRFLKQTSRSQRILSLFVVACLLFSNSLFAQEADKEEAPQKDKPKQAVESLLPKPIVIINFASIERILQDIDLVFELAERPEIAEIASASLANVNDLEGLDHNKNLGVEVFLKTGLLPQPVFVSYLPVSKIRSFIETLEALIPGDEEKIKKDTKRDDIYTIEGRRGESIIRLQDSYAHMLFRGGETDETLDLIISRDFGDPAQSFQTLTNDYDLSVKLDFSAIPELMRTTFLGFFRTAIETQLQQRDNETDAAYELRRMSGKQNLEGIEYMLNEAQELVLGARVDQEQKQGNIDILIKARPNSDLARDIKNVPGKASYFSVITSRANLPAAVSMSMNVARRDRKTYLNYLTYAEKQLTEKLLTEDERLQKNHSVQQFFAPIKSVVDKGHLDLFAQLVATPSKKFALIGGMKVSPSANLPAALLDLVNRVEQRAGKDVRIFTNAETVQGIALHQLQPNMKTADDKQNRFLGGVPSLYVGADSQVIWFAMGTEIAVGALNEAIEQINNASPEARKEQRTAPFQAEFHMRPWLSLFSEAEIDQSGIMKIFDGAFQKENDLILITTQPLETGIRTRIQVDEGYLKLLGISISKQFDSIQERRAKRERDRAKKKGLPMPVN